MIASIDIVVPTVGRGSLAGLLAALGPQLDGLPGRVVVVDDAPSATRPLPGVAQIPRSRVSVVPGRSAGPAAARNTGWRRSHADWIAFLDDDVIPDPDWVARLRNDLLAAPAHVAAVQGRVAVPQPEGRPPTDWERNVAGLERAQWATADMAYRRADLIAAGGFDERFPRAYREDADLGLRTVRRGRAIVAGTRRVTHPARPAPWWISLRLQAGNADDALMRALHGPAWRAAAGTPRGRLPRHLATVASAAVALGAPATRRRRLAALAGTAWAVATAELVYARVGPGPRTRTEVARMVATSVPMPFAAVAWRTAGTLRRLWTGAPPWPQPPGAVLLDRDGTLIVDQPYNGDPAAVVPMKGAVGAVARLRAAGVKLAVVSNQSGIGRGLISVSEVAAVNRRVEELFGPLGPWLVCPHAPEDACDCRKPAPGLVVDAARRLGVPLRECAVIGDIGADVQAATAAGARSVLVPTPRTLPEERRAAAAVVPDLARAVDLLLGARP